MDWEARKPEMEALGWSWALVDLALRSADPLVGSRLAREALANHEGCSGAYLILGREKLYSDPEEAARLCARGVEVAEEMLSAPLRDLYAFAKGEFYHLPDAKRYVEARGALARCLREAAGVEEISESLRLERRSLAVEHAQSVLVMDAYDHLNIAHTLIDWLIEDDGEEEAQDLLQRFPCACVHHAYCEALLMFRRFGGRDQRTSRALGSAFRSNPEVPLFLLGRRELPCGDRRISGSGTEPENFDIYGEAGGYAAGSIEQWKSSPGALRWVEVSATENGLL